MNVLVKCATYFLLCLCLLTACKKSPQQVSGRASLTKQTTPFVTSAKPPSIQAKYIDPDSLLPPTVVPLKRPPKVVPAHANVHRAGQPKVKEIPKDLMVVTPGKDGVPPPISLPAVTIKKPALHAKPTPALPLFFKETAIYDMNYLSDEQGFEGWGLTLLEDSRGNFWMDGPDGVYRYDGQNFFHYTEKEGFMNNVILSMLEDSKGNIWFAGLQGICYYDGQHFFHFTEDESYGSYGCEWATCMALAEDRQGNIWFWNAESGKDGGGVYKYEPEGDRGNFTIFRKEHGLYKDARKEQNYFAWEAVNAIMEDSRGHIWWATNGSGVMRYDGQHIVYYTEKEGLIDNSISCMLEDKEGHIWFGNGGRWTSGKGVSRYTPNPSSPYGTGGTFANFTKKEGLSGDRVRNMAEDENGNIWFTTYTSGVTRFDGKNFTHFTMEEGFGNNGAIDVMEDSQGNIWTSLDENELIRLRPNSFVHFTEKQGLTNGQINHIVEDRQGNIWMATSYGGVVKYDGENFTQYTEQEGLPQDFVKSMLADSKGNIWFATRDKGICKFDGRVFTNYTAAQGLSCMTAWDLYEDKKGQIWVACGINGGGITRLNLDNGQVTQFTGADALAIGDANIHEDSHGNLWLGAAGWVAKHDSDKDQVDFMYEIDPENHRRVDFLIEDENKDLWFGTGENLAHVVKNEVGTDGHLVHYKKGNELPDLGFMVTMQVDRQRNIWFSGRLGIALLIGGLEKLENNEPHWIKYDKPDGLKNRTFQPNSVLLDSKNRIWWGSGGTGVTMLDLNNFKLPTEAPKNLGLSHLEMQQQYIEYAGLSDTTYRSTLAFGDPMSQSFDSVAAFNNFPTNLTLPHYLDHLTFHFTASDWSAPHKIQYSYKMEGLDQDWSDPQISTVADYRNLPFGNYTFKVKAMGEAQVWSEPFDYAFTIRPPWWQTWWAYSLYVLLAVGAAGGYMLRMRRKIREKQEQLEREQYLNRELRELNIATSRFVPKDFLNILDKNTLQELQLGDQTEANMTVLFADIRDYTGLSESMTPEQNFKFINAYLGRMGPIIQEHGGFICQYYGDGIMALFKDNHDQAVKAAVEMQQALQRYNRKRFARNRQPIQVGIGLNTGKLMLGVIGDQQRYDTSVISDAVNTASRMEGLTKIFGCQVIVSEKTLLELNINTEVAGKDTHGGDYRFLGKVKVKGKDQVLKIYDFYDSETEEVSRLKSETKTLFEKALQLYYDRQFGKAADVFKIILEKYPSDVATHYYMDKSVKYIIDGVDASWSGVEEMVSK